MRTIWKYEINIEDFFVLSMPIGSSILTLQIQRGKPCLWVSVDTEQPMEARTFNIYGTGHPIPDKRSINNYIGTFQVHNGDFVFHIFEV